MQLQELLAESLDVESNDVWERERTANALTGVAVRLHSAGLSLRETAAILDLLGVNRSHQAIWQWTHRLADSGTDPPTAQPSRVAVDETAVQINGEWCWVYAAIDLDTMFLLDIEVISRHSTDPAAAFFHRLTEKQDLAKTTFLVDGYGYSTALARLGLSGRRDYTDQNHIERWFQLLIGSDRNFHHRQVPIRARHRMVRAVWAGGCEILLSDPIKGQTDRFHTSWVGSRQAVRDW